MRPAPNPHADLCGEGLCADVACASYRIKGRDVYLCASHLAELLTRARLTLPELARKLPGFALLSSAFTTRGPSQ